MGDSLWISMGGSVWISIGGSVWISMGGSLWSGITGTLWPGIIRMTIRRRAAADKALQNGYLKSYFARKADNIPKRT
jgi:hypothetical protein